MAKNWWEETPEEFVAGFSEEIVYHQGIPAMGSLSVVARNERVPLILERTGIPFQQYPMVVWSLEHGFDVEEGDEHKSLLEYEGIWTPEQRQALEQLFRDGTIKTITQVEHGRNTR